MNGWRSRTREIRDGALRIVQFLPIVAGITCILQLGPFLQYYFSSLATVKADSIYAAAYGQSITTFPTFGAAIFDITLRASLPCAIAILVVGLRERNAREHFFATAVTAAVVLTVVDLTLVLSKIEPDLPVGTALVSNIVGGFAISLVLTFIIGVSEAAALFVRSEGQRLVVQRSVFFGLCVTFAFLTYLILKTLYEPIPSNVRLVARVPLSGWVVPLAKEDPEGSKRLRSFFPERATGTKVNYTGKGFSAEWRSNKTPYDLQIITYDGCNWRDYQKLPKATGRRLDKVSRLSITTDDNLVDVDVLSDAGAQASMNQLELARFWINEAKENSLNIQSFVGHETGATVQTLSNPIIVLRLWLMDSDGKSVRSTNRIVRVGADGQTSIMRFLAPRGVSKGECRALAGEQYATRSATLLIKLIAPPDAVEMFNDPPVEIRSMSGWLELQQVPVEDLKGEYFGKVSSFGIDSGIDALTVGGIKQEVADSDSIWTFGSFDVLSGNNKSLAWDGTAKALWRNGVRINATAWEQLAGNWGVWLLGGLIAICIALWRRSMALLIAAPAKRKGLWEA